MGTEKSSKQQMTEIMKKPLERAWLARLLAKSIDLMMAFVVALLWFPFGFLIAVAYLLIADGLANGESIGKKIMGMRVICVENGEKCDWKRSCLRNLPLVAPLLLMVIPVIGWLVGAALFIIFSAVEIYLLSSFRSTQRLGDMMAETTVIVDGKKPMEEEAHPTSWFTPEVNLM